MATNELSLEPIWRWSASHIADAVRTKQISAVDVVSAVLARIEDVNPSINAFALIDAQGALEQAHLSDQARAKGAPAGPLEGVPFHVKDLVPTAGLETSYGSWAMQGNVPQTDACAVARVKSAGAILIGKTTTPEFGTKIHTESPRYGTTRNPWRLTRSPGGSSGGAAAAVASGMGPLALNTDGAGSARIPASCCGILGYKPSLGLVPNDMASALFENNQYIGLNTRTVGDLVSMLTVINGPDPGDPWTLGRKRKEFVYPQDPRSAVRGLQLLYVPLMGNSTVDADVTALVDGALGRLRELGVKVTTLAEPFDWGIELSTAWLKGMLQARLVPLLTTHRTRLDPELVAVLDGANDVTVDQRASLPLQRTQLYRRVQHLFESADLIISPTLAAPPIALDHRSSEQLIIDGAGVGTLREAWYPYTSVANMTGHPAISIPVGFTPDRLPVGLHAMGHLHQDQRLIDLAAALEILQPWGHAWPGEPA